MDYDVHFSLGGFYTVEASSIGEARQMVEKFLHDNVPKAGSLLCVALEDNRYTTDVVRSNGIPYKEVEL